MLRSALIALALLISTPAVPETPAVIPVDATARAKFPNDSGPMVDALAYVNKAINAAITPMSDQEHYGVADMWVMAPADGKGDCEDYTLTKIFVLQQAGFDIVGRTRLVAVFVHQKVKGVDSVEGHAILAVRLVSGAIMFLDNRYPEPMTHAELAARGYEIIDWRV
jgi:predicted transglutaminase-like cysteine proteinase